MSTSASINVFDILALRREEEPHDRMLAWLADPTERHGIADFAADIVRVLWHATFSETPRSVKRQYQLSPQCFPDMAVEFESGLLILENKVNASALRAGQLELQNQLGKARCGTHQLYHVLLHPDRLSVDGLGVRDDTFRCLTYSKLAALVRAAGERSPIDDAQVILRQYADYLACTYGMLAPPGVRMASGTKIARRNASVGWSEEEFLARADQQCAPLIRQRQSDLLDLLRSMDAVEVRFDAVGRTNPTYKVYVAGTEIHLLWVYANGGLYVHWKSLRTHGINDGVMVWKARWNGAINQENPNDSFARGGLTAFSVEDVARRLQVVADFVARNQCVPALAVGSPENVENRRLDGWNEDKSSIEADGKGSKL